MAVNRFGKKFLKSASLAVGLLMVLLMGFHFWFKAHAKGLIEDMVESKSNNKLKLKIEKIRFNYFSKKIQIEKALFFNTDSTSTGTAYQFEVDNIQLQVSSILPIVFKKQLLIDSLTLINPQIEVTRLKARKKQDTALIKDISIPEEMGKIYTSIKDALKMLEIKRFIFNNGTFTLTNKTLPDQIPVRITNIDFYVDNMQVNDLLPAKKQKFLFSDNIVLKTTNQDILFPDGRHRLSFSKFKIDLQKKLVQFDSCTIGAIKTESNNASFNVFFDALKLTNIDFDTLYHAEIIKADSVYCMNPKFNLEIDADKKTGNKNRPKLENIIQQLTGDIELKQVIVQNADFNIKTIKNEVPSSFTFSNNNFEMQGLIVNQQAPKPITVKSFVMAIRNYENFIKDSTYTIKFDSVLFRDDRITLSNFLFTKQEGSKIVNTFRIPQFNLQGLSWDDLVFENKLKADQATMFYPNINYAVSNKKKRQPIFYSLGVANEFMDLQYLEVIDGTIDLKLKNDVRIQLQNANVSVQSNSLLTSTKIAGIKSSLTQLSFKKGNMHAGNVDIALNDIRYTGKSGRFGAGNIELKNKSNNIFLLLQDVAVEKMIVDEAAGNVFADGVKWQKANVKIKTFPGEKLEEPGIATIDLKNVQGSNTTFHTTSGDKSISAAITTASFKELTKKPGSKLLLDGLAIKGNNIIVRNEKMDATADYFNVIDNNISVFTGVLFKSNSEKMDVTVTSPGISLTPHVQQILDGNVSVDDVTINKPIINIASAASVARGVSGLSPKIGINEIHLLNPEITYSHKSDSGYLHFNWKGSKNETDVLRLNDLQLKNGLLTMTKASFNLTNAIYTTAQGKSLITSNAKISAYLRNLRFQLPNTKASEWAATVSKLSVNDFMLDSIGTKKTNLEIHSAQVNEFTINSSSIRNIRELMASNKSFSFENLTGEYTNSNHAINWFNAGFSRGKNALSIDSFSLLPIMPLDSFLATLAFQKDYFSIKTGAIKAQQLDIDDYIQNNTIYSRQITVDKFRFKDYKDKQIPFKAGIIKPLPSGLLRQIPLQLSIDSIMLSNADVEYTEVNEKNKQPGTVPVKRLTATLLNVKNYDYSGTDSLTIKATGYVMDSIWTKLQVKESYTDSLGGFLMTLRMKPGDITVLNPAIIPLASVKILSGRFDTLNMRAIGREYLALGKMAMFYDGLKIELLINGIIGKKNFFSRFKNFAANTFVVRNNNKSRVGNVFFIRNRDKSAINYLIKIALSGMASSVGAKSNKKMIRKYKQELEKRKLPAIDME